MGFLLNLIGGPIISKVFGAVTNSIEGWAERKKIRTQAKIELEHKRATADIDWDMSQVDASKTSWKDEFWTIMLAIPMVLAFIPGMSDHVKAGFLVLKDDTPDWYKVGVAIAISASFGIRQFAKRQMKGNSKP
jgi:hypothetical protein